jgi:hypothetical protein
VIDGVSRSASARSGVRSHRLAPRLRGDATMLPALGLALLVASLGRAAPAHASPAAVDAEKPGATAPPFDPWPLAVVDRPLTLPRGMATASFASANYWSPSTPERSYFGPTAAFALHDRVQLEGGLPFAVCWDRGSRACLGSSSLDRVFLGLAFALRRREGFSLATGVVGSIEKYSAPAQHRTSVWFTGKRTWFHRLALLGRAELSVGWEHTLVVPVTPANASPVMQLNQTRLYWTEEIEWQVIDQLMVYAYGNPYRPIGAPGDESWATRVGGGVVLSMSPRWSLAASCAVENIMPVRSWQYVPNATDCFVSASLFRLPD